METVLVIGHDSRMCHVAKYLYHLGYEVVEEDESFDVLVLPPVAGEQELSFLQSNLDMVKSLYYGKLPQPRLEELRGLGVSCHSYLEWEEVTRENAVLTARGILREATAQRAVIKESHCLVTGFGFCAKAIIDCLLAQDANVSVLVRRKELKGEIEALGCEFLNMKDKKSYSYEKFSYVFNTVPSLVVTEDILELFPANIQIFDIASKPGGVDFSYCQAHGIAASLHLGIPGKLFPKEAGELIGKYIGIHLSEEHLPA